MASSHVVGGADAAQRRREARQHPSPPRRTPVERRRLEEALDAALSVVEAAVALLDVMDGNPDLEPACEDEGAQCEDEGAGDDREPDQDGDGMVERSWQIGGREVHLIDGAARSWAERYGHHGHASASRDVCDAHTSIDHLHDAGGSPRNGHDTHTRGRRLHDGGGWPSSGDCHDGNTSRRLSPKGTHILRTLNPDDVPDPLQPPRFGYGCAG